MVNQPQLPFISQNMCERFVMQLGTVFKVKLTLSSDLKSLQIFIGNSKF